MDEVEQQSRRRIDVFAVLLAVFILGLGAWLSTYPAEIIRTAGIALMAVSIVGLLAWFAWGRLTSATWTPEGEVKSGRLRAMTGVAIVLAIFGIAYVALHWPPVPPRPPASTPAPAPAKPWVTKEEIESQKKLGRALLIYSPDELIGMEGSGDDVDLYMGSWIKIDYPIAVVPFPYTYKKQNYIGAEMTELPYRAMGVLPGVIALFDPKKWRDRLLDFRKGDTLTAFCHLLAIIQGQPTALYGIRHDLMLVDNCDLP